MGCGTIWGEEIGMMSRRKARTGDVNRNRGAGTLLSALLVATILIAAGSVRADVALVSKTSTGLEGNGPSSGPVSDADGSCVAFYSEATNFPTRIGPDAKHTPFRDVYVFDLTDGLLRRVNVNDSGQEANGPSQTEGYPPSIDNDCTCVAFSSDATNLVPDDGNRTTDVFVRTLLDPPSTELESVSSTGERGNRPSLFGRLSGNCLKVAFQSLADNLVPDDTNGKSDIFVHNRADGTTQRVNLAPGGIEADADSVQPAISNDGRCVAFVSAATNLLPGDTRGKKQIYVSCDGEVVCRGSADANGTPGNGESFLPSLSADGNLVAFKSEASNLVPGDNNLFVDVYVHDCASGETQRVSISATGGNPNDNSFGPSISGDGRFIAFGSFATNLVPRLDPLGQAQMYVRDLTQQRTTIVSVSPMGKPGNGSVPDLPPGTSLDGKFVAFASLATNLVPGVRNGFLDAFIGSSVTSCQSDDQCPSGEMCIDGQCVIPTVTPTPIGTETPTPSPTPTVTPTPFPCVNTIDCPSGFVCVDGTCQPAPTVTPTIACTSTDQCPPPLECVDGVCRDLSTPTPTPTPRPPCTTNEECPDDLVCRENVCVPQVPCDPVDGPACPGGSRETCVNEVCECSGDCNLDGYVVGTETTMMVCVAEGQCELDTTCPAGDIDHNGMISGTEICQAVTNLELGCPGPGTALRFQQDRTDETRSIDVGSNEGFRGTPVNIPISMSGGGDVATIQFDLLFSGTALTIANADVDCVLDQRLTATEQSFQIMPQNPSNPPGTTRLRVFIANLQLCEDNQPFPVSAFDEGPIFSCNFLINAGATPGTYPLTIDTTPIGDGLNGLSRLEIGDPTGERFTSTTTPGAVTVNIQPCTMDDECPENLVCRGDMCVPVLPCTGPTEGPTECREGLETCLNDQCECTGDCNLDGVVTGLEIATVINIFGGVEDLVDCPSADQDGTGSVSGLDVAVAITNFGIGCPAVRPSNP